MLRLSSPCQDWWTQSTRIMPRVDHADQRRRTHQGSGASGSANSRTQWTASRVVRLRDRSAMSAAEPSSARMTRAVRRWRVMGTREIVTRGVWGDDGCPSDEPRDPTPGPEPQRRPGCLRSLGADGAVGSPVLNSEIAETGESEEEGKR